MLGYFMLFVWVGSQVGTSSPDPFAFVVLIILLAVPGALLVSKGCIELLWNSIPVLGTVYPILLKVCGVYLAALGLIVFAANIAMIVGGTLNLAALILALLCALFVLVGVSMYDRGKVR